MSRPNKKDAALADSYGRSFGAFAYDLGVSINTIFFLIIRRLRGVFRILSPHKNEVFSMDEQSDQQSAEVIIGLVGAAGTNLDAVSKILGICLETYDYRVIKIRLSQKLQELGGNLHLPPDNSSESDRVNKLMTAGNTLRRKTDDMAAVATLAIDEIRRQRKIFTGDEENITKRHCYICHSLKNKDEIRMLRKVYKDHFLLISIFEPRQDRVLNLARRIAESEGDTDREKYQTEAEQIITRDYREDDEYGQKVSDAFAEADFFLRYSDDKINLSELERFFQICFGHPFHTPRRDEMGMYWAHAAALRSADLSRQVGAAITTQRGELLATGCNEVPTKGGGLPWPDDVFDPRDYARGFDENTRIKNEAVKEIITSLKRANWFNLEISKLSDKDLIRKLEKDDAVGFKNMRLRNLIEFGRVVHAEMNTLVDAARRGIAIEGGVLFCTTFPCHMCARHLLAAGLRKVVFIEPYPKSLAGEIYGDLIASEDDSECTSFQSFRGVAPRFFMKAFEMRKRKTSDGHALSWSPRMATLDEIVSTVSYTYPEQIVLSELIDRIEASDTV